MQKRLIVFLLALLPIFANSTTSLQAKSGYWIINEKSRLGAVERVRSVQQDPYPFCFSAAAALLWDQQRCMADKKNCKTYPQTSLLAITGAGQGSSDININTLEGGSTELSLRRLLDVGGASYESCKYTNYKIEEGVLAHWRAEWKRYSPFSPYLARVNRRQFIMAVRSANPNITEERIDELLRSDLVGSAFVGELLISQNCFSTIKDDRFIIRTAPLSTDKKEAFVAIDKLLARKIPVAIAFCLIDGKDVKECQNRHAAIIIAKAKAKHSITGEIRTFYWVVNTWGESWQDKNADGWVAADLLHQNMFGDLIWLEYK